jgi:hypothetical protein
MSDMHDMAGRLRDWWRGYTAHDVCTAQWKLDNLAPTEVVDVTAGEQRAIIALRLRPRGLTPRDVSGYEADALR